MRIRGVFIERHRFWSLGLTRTPSTPNQHQRIAGWVEGAVVASSVWEHHLIQHRRFAHILRDLDYTLQTTGTSRAVLLQAFPGPGPQPLANWMRLLGALQHTDQTVRKIGAHMEYESVTWTAVFTMR